MEDSLRQRLAKGEESAYKHLFDTYYKRLVNFSNRYFRDIDVAKEVVQTVFIRIYQSRSSLHDVQDIPGYLYRAVYNECLNEVKKQTTRARYHSQYASFTDDVFYEQSLEQSEKEHRIYSAINALPTRCREIFIMSRIDGKKNPEIAAELNLSVRTVETQISIALKNLRDAILIAIATSFLFRIFF